jgi:hypothetical protein
MNGHTAWRAVESQGAGVARLPFLFPNLIAGRSGPYGLLPAGPSGDSSPDRAFLIAGSSRDAAPDQRGGQP